MPECPRVIEFNRGASRYRVEFHYDPVPPGDRCSNPECHDPVAFAKFVVVERIFCVVGREKNIIDQNVPLWGELRAIVQLREGHGHSQCAALVCDGTMDRRNYLATIVTYQVEIPSLWTSKKYMRKAERKRRAWERKRRKEERKAKRIAAKRATGRACRTD